MVTWGANQVFNFGNAPGANASNTAPAPAGGSLFGSTAPAAPAGGSLFGSTAAAAPAGGSLFGNTAPAAPAGGSLFGSTAPAPAGGGMFGKATAADAAPTSLFGSKPAGSSLFGNTATATPAPSSLFGATTPSTSLFGNTAGGSSLFGGATMNTMNTAVAPAQPAIPAQAALQAHMDAQARQDEAKLQSSLGELVHAYTGTINPQNPKPSPFVTIVYNNMTSQEMQWQFANQQAVGVGGYTIPPRPPNVSEESWLEAVVSNSYDRTTHTPTALVGAEALQARVGWQQDMATKHANESVKTIRTALDEVQRRHAQLRQNLQQLQTMHASVRGRMLRIMNKTEVVRCLNLPLQNDEIALAKRFQNMLINLDQLNRNLAPHSAMVANKKDFFERKAPSLILPNSNEQKDRLAEIFTEHRKSLVYLTETLQKEKQDLYLIKDRVVQA